MKTLTVKNIGPIRDVTLTLKRINVIIGPQSAGKSCLLKIACFCAWVEKRIMLQHEASEFQPSFIESFLIDFYKMEGFVKKGDGAFFAYDTERLTFSYHFDSQKFTYTWKENHRWQYLRSRVSYIPSERNVIAVIPNWMEVNLGYNNVRNFISDWNLARQTYSSEHVLPVIDLGVDYCYDQHSGQDYILLKEGQRLELTQASSGLQSVVPMWVYLDYLFNKQYDKNNLSKISVETENEEVLLKIYIQKFMPHSTDTASFFGKVGRLTLKFVSSSAWQECVGLYEAFTKTHASDIYLEEPEQNLFPETQVQLVNQLLAKASVHHDNLFIATHSPYILYALNNCMLGYKVREKVQDADLLRQSSSWVDPQDVAVWELRDGHLSSDVDPKNLTLQDEDGLVRGNYFDRVMKGIMADFTNLSMYYD